MTTLNSQLSTLNSQLSEEIVWEPEDNRLDEAEESSQKKRLHALDLLYLAMEEQQKQQPKRIVCGLQYKNCKDGGCVIPPELSVQTYLQKGEWCSRVWNVMLTRLVREAFRRVQDR